jgi:hypothetical protein
MTRFPAHARRARTWGLAALLACTISSTWSEAPPLPPAAPLRLAGPGPYYQVGLPLSWQARSRQGALADVRVLNGQGDALPYAWVDLPDTTAVAQHVRLPLFRWEGPKSPPVSASAPPSVASPSSPSWPIWVVDLRQVQGAVRRLHLSLPERQAGLFAVAVESSADLQNWTTVRDAAQLVALPHEGQLLRQADIELPGIRSPYLRLRLLPGSPQPELADVEITTTEDIRTTPAWSWSSPINPTSCSAQACDYTVPEHVPLGRLKVMLTEANTLLDLQVLSKDDAASAPPAPPSARHRHHLRERLNVLREKGRDNDDEDRTRAPADPWTWLAQGQVHWIQRADAQERSDELALPASSHQMLRLSSASGDSGWTRRPPAIQVATWSRSLVFLARGPQPYRLAWADPSAPATAWPMAQLMPTTTGQSAPTVGQAELDMATPTPPSTPTSLAPPGPASAASAAPGPTSSLPRAWLLWAVLLLGVGSMAWMARSLFDTRKK